LPGWGGSQRPQCPLTLDEAADVLDALLRQEGRAPPVVANSLGCQIALRLAVRPDSPVGPLVFIGPTVDPRYRAWTHQAFRLLLDATREPVRLWPLLVADYARMGPARVLATARGALADRPERCLPHLENALLVIRGERDAVTTHVWARRCAELAPAGAFVGVADAAHAVHFSHAPVLAPVIEAFLEKRLDSDS
jgi:pimeloyl-ACP methyl ester carboxylesterase